MALSSSTPASYATYLRQPLFGGSPTFLFLCVKAHRKRPNSSARGFKEKGGRRGCSSPQRPAVRGKPEGYMAARGVSSWTLGNPRHDQAHPDQALTLSRPLDRGGVCAWRLLLGQGCVGVTAAAAAPDEGDTWKSLCESRGCTRRADAAATRGQG